MPKFKPLRISRSDMEPTRRGVVFRILLRKERLKKLPIRGRLNIAGTVPRPNNVMKAAPVKPFPLVIAPATPMYTRPQGRRPFKTPIIRRDS